MRTEEGLLLLNEAGKVLWSNTVAAELLGFSRDELAAVALPLVGEQTIPSAGVATQRILLPPPTTTPSGGSKSSPSPVMGSVSSLVAPSSPMGPVATAFRS